MSACPVVRVIHPDKAFPFLEINELDFDPTKHERYIEPPPAAVAPVLPPPPPGAPDPLANLPANWREGDASELRKLAAAVGDGRAVENTEQAIAVIDAELAKRAAK